MPSEALAMVLQKRGGRSREEEPLFIRTYGF